MTAKKVVSQAFTTAVTNCAGSNERRVDQLRDLVTRELVAEEETTVVEGEKHEVVANVANFVKVLYDQRLTPSIKHTLDILAIACASDQLGRSSAMERQLGIQGRDYMLGTRSVH